MRKMGQSECPTNAVSYYYQNLLLMLMVQKKSNKNYLYHPKFSSCHVFKSQEMGAIKFHIFSIQKCYHFNMKLIFEN